MSRIFFCAMLLFIPLLAFISEGTSSTKTIDRHQTLQASPEARQPSANPSLLTISANQTQGLAPLAVSFTASHHQDGEALLSSEWNFGDGESKTQLQTQHLYTAPGHYTVTFRAIDQNGDLHQKSLQITAL